MQHVAFFSCRNGVGGRREGVMWKSLRIMLNILHNLLLNNANIGWQFAKANFKIKINFFENLLQKKPVKTRQPQ